MRISSSLFWPLSPLILGVLLFTPGCNRSPEVTSPASPVNSDSWHEFQGTWIASGNRQTIRLGGNRLASIAQLSGSLLLSGPSKPELGFLADALVLNDTETGTIGRAVWTDDRGDHVYSELKGEPTITGSKISGAITGGSGKYAGATGSYQFSWRFVMDTEDGHVQGQSEDLTGRLRVGGPVTSGGTGEVR